MSRRIALLCVMTVSLAAPAAHAKAGLSPCTVAIGKAVSKYVKGKRKAMASCEDKRSKGTLAPSVNCRPADGAVTDASTAAKLQRLADKVAASIGAKCSGPLPPLGPACDSATTVAALAACITAPAQDADVEPINVDTLIAAVYDANAPVTDAGLRACQAAISKSGGKYLAARMKADQKCSSGHALAKASACPDAAAATRNEMARAKMEAAIRKACTEPQVASSTPPKLDFGPPCEAYKLMTYKRGPANSNTVPVLDRLLRCITDAHAGVADRMSEIAFPNPDYSGFQVSAFTDGVAAGDATDSAAIFWTRLPSSATSAFLDVSTDATFATGVQTLTVTGDSDGIVKEEVGSLLANTAYYYRFRQGTNTSAAGRVKTTPSPADGTTVIHLGWSGDSNAFYRPYTSLDPIRLLNPDAWLYIGDTIYGDDPRPDGVIAMTQPEYEAKYRANRSDAALRSMMESTGTYVQWDDHEVRNDFAGAEPVFAARLSAGNAAFRRYMPLRENGGDPMQLYRSFQWGTGAEFFLIDDRQYRSAKYTCCSNAPDSGFVTTDDDSTCTGGMSGEALFPSAPCVAAMAGGSRTILGSTQKAWLKSGLLNSTATFKFIMNGPPITELVFLPYDRWEAWIAERDEILNYVETNGIKNVIWLTTDLHAVVSSPTHLNSNNLTHPGIELVVGSIGETALFRELPASIVSVLPLVPGTIMQVSEYEIDRYNTVMITVDPTPLLPTAKFDIYDRTGSLIHSIPYTAVP